MCLDDLQSACDCVIGHGSSATVRRVLHKASNTWLALKAIQFDVSSNEVRKRVTTELRTLFKSFHPNIISYYQSFLDAGCITIAMEFMDGGSLQHILDRQGGRPLQEAYISIIARQILQVGVLLVPTMVLF